MIKFMLSHFDLGHFEFNIQDKKKKKKKQWGML